MKINRKQKNELFDSYMEQIRIINETPLPYDAPDPLRLKATHKVVTPRGGEGIKYHDTVVVEILNDGSFVLNSGGWMTATTKRRINQYTPFSVFQKDGIWYVQTSRGRFEFYDGMRITEAGNLIEDKE